MTVGLIAELLYRTEFILGRTGAVILITCWRYCFAEGCYDIQHIIHLKPCFSCYSVDVADGVCQSDPVEVKRRRRGLHFKKIYKSKNLPCMKMVCWHVVSCVSDVVISFVKKTVAGVAGLLRLRKPLPTRCENPRHYEETQVRATTPSVRRGLQNWVQGQLKSTEHFGSIFLFRLCTKCFLCNLTTSEPF